MLRIATYVRVSSDTQTTDNQVPEVEQLAAQRGAVVQRYVETGSAAKARPVFDQMLRDAKRGRFDVLVIWAIDRFGRNMAGNIADMLELDRVGVRVVSVRETWLDTSGPTKGLLVAVFSWAAEQERARLSERTKAGLARAKRQGKRLGRPRVRVDVACARAVLAEAGSVRETARRLGLGLGTLQRALAASP